jgi:hypothetical protein
LTTSSFRVLLCKHLFILVEFIFKMVFNLGQCALVVVSGNSLDHLQLLWVVMKATKQQKLLDRSLKTWDICFPFSCCPKMLAMKFLRAMKFISYVYLVPMVTVFRLSSVLYNPIRNTGTSQKFRRRLTKKMHRIIIKGSQNHLLLPPSSSIIIFSEE